MNLNKNKQNKFIISEDFIDQRLDNYLLREYKKVPKQLIYKLIRKGKIRLNNKKATQATKLAINDEVIVPAISFNNIDTTKEIKQFTMPKILYQDSNYLIFDKPSGLAVHGGSGLNYGLIELARQYFQEPNLELAHRLDKETSGIVILTKSRKGLKEIHELFRLSKVTKIYRALVFNQWLAKNNLINLPTIKIPASKGGKRSIVAGTGKTSITKCRLIKQYKNIAELEIKLITGKTHQARVHLAAVNNPIVNDSRYGNREQNRQLKKFSKLGLMLHASTTQFYSKLIDKKITVQSNLPKRFIVLKENYLQS